MLSQGAKRQNAITRSIIIFLLWLDIVFLCDVGLHRPAPECMVQQCTIFGSKSTRVNLVFAFLSTLDFCIVFMLFIFSFSHLSRVTLLCLCHLFMICFVTYFDVVLSSAGLF